MDLLYLGTQWITKPEKKKIRMKFARLEKMCSELRAWEITTWASALGALSGSVSRAGRRDNQMKPPVRAGGARAAAETLS